MIRAIAVTFVSLFAILAVSSQAQDVIYAGSEVSNQIFSVDPDTGERTLIGNVSGIAGGIVLKGIAVESSGDIVGTMEGFGGFGGLVFRMDPSDGSTTVISRTAAPGTPVGSGVAFVQPRHVSVDTDDSLIVSDLGFGGILRVHPATGSREVITSSAFASPSVGTGPDTSYWRNAEVFEEGTLVLGDFSGSTVLEVDEATGDRSIVSDTVSVGSGPLFSDLRAGLVVNDSGTIYVTDNTVGIMAVDHGTGNRAEVSGGGAGSGTAFDGELWDIDYLSDGTLVVTDAFTELGSPGDTMIEGIFTVNPNTGARAILSSTAVGSGDAFPAGGVQHLAVMRNPVPVELSVFQTD